VKIVRDRADARWLPSRFNFALFRLFAYVRLRMARPQPRPGLMLSIDRYQSAAENYIVCVVVMIVVASFFHSPLVGAIVAIVAPQIAIPVVGTILGIFVSADSSRVEANSMLMLVAIIAVSVYFARESYVAQAFLGLVVLNGVAAAVLFLLRGSVARLERRFE